MAEDNEYFRQHKMKMHIIFEEMKLGWRVCERLAPIYCAHGDKKVYEDNIVAIKGRTFKYAGWFRHGDWRGTDHYYELTSEPVGYPNLKYQSRIIEGYAHKVRVFCDYCKDGKACDVCAQLQKERMEDTIQRQIDFEKIFAKYKNIHWHESLDLGGKFTWRPQVRSDQDQTQT